MADRFPKDCWEKKCPHFHYWDMSIDDYTCFCDLLKLQCDACDEDFISLMCPLTEEKDGVKSTYKLQGELEGEEK